MSKNRETFIERLRREASEKSEAFREAVNKEDEWIGFCQKLRRKLADIRVKRGIDQYQMAEKLEMSQSAVSKIENGKGDIGLLSICRYADALGLSPIVLFGRPVEAELDESDAQAQKTEEELLYPSWIASTGVLPPSSFAAYKDYGQLVHGSSGIKAIGSSFAKAKLKSEGGVVIQAEAAKSHVNLNTEQVEKIIRAATSAFENTMADTLLKTQIEVESKSGFVRVDSTIEH